jgi:succinoglycan biosynthesis transport protein ExoP
MNDQASGPTRNSAGGQLVPTTQTLPRITDPYGPPPDYGAAGVEASEPFRLKLLETWRILNKRKWLILGIAASLIALNTIRTLMQTPLYTATVRLQIEREAKIVEGGDIMPDAPDYEFMQTQLQLLRSFMMAHRVASVLRLEKEPDFFKPKNFSFIRAVREMLRGSGTSDQKTPAKLQRAAAGIISGNVQVQSVGKSRLIDISYSDPEPKRARRIANAYADAFVATNLDKRFQSNAQAKVFLEDKIQQLKLRLEESERKLVAFAQEQQIVDVTSKASIADSNLAAANAELGALIAQRTKQQQLWQQLEAADAINLPQLLSDPVISSLRNQRRALLLRYQEKLQTFRPEYPEMVQLSNQMKEIDTQLASEVQTLKESSKASYDALLAQENIMKERILSLKKELLDLQKRSIEYNSIQREVDTNRDLYTSLLQRYKEVDLASGVVSNNVFIADAAGLPSAPSSPNWSHALLLGLAFGLAGGLAVAYALERMDDKIRSGEQIEAISGLAILGVIPNSSEIAQDTDDPHSGIAEAYRSLCTSLLFATENGLPKTLAITSSTPSEGKSLTSMFIAKHFAILGRKVLLIDADLRNPSLHVKLNCDNSIGLSNYLTGACTPPEAAQKTAVPSLAFIASGPLPPNAADLLAGARLHSLLSIGSEVFDLIILDGPPVLGLADAQIIASATAATLFVVGAGQTRAGLLTGSLRRLHLSRASVIGAVLTKYDLKAAGYGYGYGYDYGYGYGADAVRRRLPVGNGSASPPQLTDAHGNA